MQMVWVGFTKALGSLATVYILTELMVGSSMRLVNIRGDDFYSVIVPTVKKIKPRSTRRIQYSSNVNIGITILH